MSDSNPSKPSGGSRNIALAALGLNVVVLAALTAVTALIDVVPIEDAERVAEMSGQLAQMSTLAMWIGALGFLPWLKKSYAHAHTLVSSPELEEHFRKGAVVGFFIPFVNLVRPYQAVRALDAALDPDAIPAPSPRLVEGEVAATYRAPAPTTRFTPRRAPPAPVRVWWALWISRLVGQVVLRVAKDDDNLVIAAYDGVVCAAAIAACVVVWRISARLAEVERRKRALEAAAAG